MWQHYPLDICGYMGYQTLAFLHRSQSRRKVKACRLEAAALELASGNHISLGTSEEPMGQDAGGGTQGEKNREEKRRHTGVCWRLLLVWPFGHV